MINYENLDTFFILLTFILFCSAVFVFNLYFHNRRLAIDIIIVFAGYLSMIAFELGKALLMASLIGIFFIPEVKDFTFGVICGTIFITIGYVSTYLYEKYRP